MSSFIATLSYVLPIIALIYVLLILLVSLYLKIRQQFSIRVNCWFCNSWFKVPYDNRNSFNCLQCNQYNGFTEDGDYNRIIPEQHDELLNKSQRISSKKSTSNGLCNICNNNQVLKVIQLARFVPMNEDNYDAEIEHFQEQLEKAYKLCRKCEKVLKNTLDIQKANIFGKHLKQMHNKSISLLKKSNIGRITNFYTKIYQILQFFIIFTTSIQIILTNKTIEFFLKDLSNDYMIILKDFVKTLKFLQIGSIQLDSHTLLCCFGILLQLFPTIRSKSFTQINRLLAWIVLGLVPFTKLQIANYLEVPVVGYLLFSSFIYESKPIKMVTKSKKIVQKLENGLYSDCSDDEIEDVSLPSTKSSTIDSITSTSTRKESDKTNCEPLINSELNKSLNNLHLDGIPTVKQPQLQRPKPVLSPPKLINIENQFFDNSFWRNSCLSPPPQQQQQQRTNLSRSSSESSGFGSQINDYNNYQYMNKTNLFGENLRRASVISEPAYYFKSFNPAPMPLQGRSFLRQEGRIFFPNLQQNNMLWIHGNFGRVTTPSFNFNQHQSNWSGHFNSQQMPSFRDLSLQSERSQSPLFRINPLSI